MSVQPVMLSESKPLPLLRRMLALLSEGGIASTADLARRLDVSEMLVAVMAEELTRRGYLARLNGGCHGSCGSCHLASACAPAGAQNGNMLVLTPKGRQAATPPLAA